MKRTISIWQVAGFLFTCILGTLLHFLFDFSGQSVIAALVSAVNESIWEHMKLLYYPMLLFAVLEHRFVGKTYPHFFCVKLVGIALGLVLIPVIYYTYTGILGVSADWFNIAIFFIAAGVTFRTETLLFRRKQLCRLSGTAAFFLLCLMGIVFTVFTFLPPHIPLFRDPVTGGYGFGKLQYPSLLN